MPAQLWKLGLVWVGVHGRPRDEKNSLFFSRPALAGVPFFPKRHAFRLLSAVPVFPIRVHKHCPSVSDLMMIPSSTFDPHPTIPGAGHGRRTSHRGDQEAESKSCRGFTHSAIVPLCSWQGSRLSQVLRNFLTASLEAQCVSALHISQCNQDGSQG